MAESLDLTPWDICMLLFELLRELSGSFSYDFEIFDDGVLHHVICFESLLVDIRYVALDLIDTSQNMAEPQLVIISAHR